MTISLPFVSEKAEASLSCGGGSDVGPGLVAVLHPNDGAAFLGAAKTIEYCFVLAPDFGVPKDQVAPLIERSFQFWSDYVSTRAILSEDPPSQQLALHLHGAGDCTGNEDLVFYLGSPTPKGHPLLSSDSIAYSRRTKYDKKTGWGSGFIWVAPQGAADAKTPLPDWSVPENLEKILVHEIGHLLGNEHVPGTIMTENLSELVEGAAQKIPVAIDGNRELAIGPLARVYYESKMREDLGLKAKGGDLKALFQALANRAPIGSPRLRLERRGTYQWQGITLVDDQGEVSLPFQQKANSLQEKKNGNQAFKREIDTKTSAYSSPQYFLPLGVTAFSGKPFPLILRVNGFKSRVEGPVIASIILGKDEIPIAVFEAGRP